MTLSILICVHSTDNLHDKLLIDSLVSLNRQTYKQFDVFIVFDECWNSTNNLVEDKDYFFKIHRLFHAKKQGLSEAKNFGLKYIDSDWVGFLDADDLYIETKLEKQISYIKNNEVDFLGTQALNRNLITNKITDSCFMLGQYETHEQISKYIKYENFLTHGSMLIKKECLDKLGGYKNVKGSEDWDLWKRAIDYGYKFHQIQERLYIWTYNTSVSR